MLSLLLLTGGQPQQKHFRDVPRFIKVKGLLYAGTAEKLVGKAGEAGEGQYIY